MKDFKGNIIYTPKGLAREYAPLAANLYTSCPHGCTYCYCPRILKMAEPKMFFSDKPKIRRNLLGGIENDCKKLVKHGITDQPIQLSFIGDPLGYGHELPISVIKILKKYELPFTILTKAELPTVREVLKVMEGYPKCSFGVSCVFLNEKKALEYEPFAELPDNRYYGMLEAHLRGIKTWVSVEPVIEPNEALLCIGRLLTITDLFWIGKINHQKNMGKDVDWKAFCGRILETAAIYPEKQFKIKSSLEKYMEK